MYLRDELGFNFLSDSSRPTTWAGATRRRRLHRRRAAGRDLNSPVDAGPRRRRPSRSRSASAINYHLLALRQAAAACACRCWLDDGEPVPSVVPVWPTADWHEREAWDLMGIRVRGPPEPARILMEDDWDGHPLRKDYPIGGEPVRFSDAE